MRRGSDKGENVCRVLVFLILENRGFFWGWVYIDWL